MTMRTPQSAPEPGPQAPVEAGNRRKHIGLKGELLLAVLPTAMVLVVMLVLEMAADRQVIFASLASSAFLIYRDPTHPMNTIRTLVISHTLTALIGYGVYLALGSGYHAAGISMVISILAMVLLDVVHPPAIGTTLNFAFRPKGDDTLLLFELSLLIIAVLALMSAGTIWLYRYLVTRSGRK